MRRAQSQPRRVENGRRRVLACRRLAVSHRDLRAGRANDVSLGFGASWLKGRNVLLQ